MQENITPMNLLRKTVQALRKELTFQYNDNLMAVFKHHEDRSSSTVFSLRRTGHMVEKQEAEYIAKAMNHLFVQIFEKAEELAREDLEKQIDIMSKEIIDIRKELAEPIQVDVLTA